MSNSKERVCSHFREIGRNKALAVQSGAVAGTISGAEFFGQSDYIPRFRPGTSEEPRHYSVKIPVQHEGILYSVSQEHDNYGDPAWSPDVNATLFFELHGVSPETARPWRQPNGAHDQYLAGEYAAENGSVYRCKQNTTYSPSGYAQAWEAV